MALRSLFCCSLIWIFISSYGFTQENQNTDEVAILDLEKCVNLALKAERPLGSALNAVGLSEFNVLLAESDFALQAFPRGDAGIIGGGKAGEGITLGTGIDITKKFLSGTRITVTPSLMKAARNYQSNLRFLISQPLLKGFGSDFSLDPLMSAKFSNRMANRNLYLAKIRLILQTIQNAYDIVKQKAMVELEKESLTRIQRFYASTILKQKIGLSDSLNVYRAEIELKHAEDSLNHSMDRLQESKDNFRDLLGLATDFAFEISLPIEFSPIEIQMEEAVSIALKNRIELDVAEDQVFESCRLERLAKKSLKPELNLVIDYTSFGFDEVLTGAWTAKRENKWGVGFTTSTDFNNVAAQAAYQQSIYATEDAKRNVEMIRDSIVLDVKRTLRTLKRAHEKIVTQEEQINNARKEFLYASLKFQHGFANNFDLIQAEKNLRMAQASLLSAVIEHKIGEYNLLATLGTLADKPKGLCR